MELVSRSPWDAFMAHMNQHRGYYGSIDEHVMKCALSRAMNVIDGVLTNMQAVPGRVFRDQVFRDQGYLEKATRSLWFSIAEKMLEQGVIPIELPTIVYYAGQYGFRSPIVEMSNGRPYDSPEKVPESAELIMIEMRVSCRHPWKIEEGEHVA